MKTAREHRCGTRRLVSAVFSTRGDRPHLGSKLTGLTVPPLHRARPNSPLARHLGGLIPTGRARLGQFGRKLLRTNGLWRRRGCPGPGNAGSSQALPEDRLQRPSPTAGGDWSVGHGEAQQGPAALLAAHHAALRPRGGDGGELIVPPVLHLLELSLGRALAEFLTLAGDAYAEHGARKLQANRVPRASRWPPCPPETAWVAWTRARACLSSLSTCPTLARIRPRTRPPSAAT